ncbi:MAG TPA: protein translocase SEC61 complex subunit gamma [Candidatus Korarchaeota archaeon]|nr:MAG: protein translocase SEC61 complex subunit gamma [Candidatus Korarchaeota archaeon]HDI86567.1 protein translocase SEC61 complex subunit gamma [Candidatus Korarchaeota archaeon]
MVGEDILEAIKRTLKVARKPTWDDLWTVFKITFLGFLLVGLIGFLLQLAVTLMSGGQV